MSNPADKSEGELHAGIIGLGEIGQFHLQGFQRADGSRVTAVCDIDADLVDNSAKPIGAKGYRTFEALLADPDLDVVSVCLPHNLHLEVTLAAIAAGKHVLVEKPFAVNTSECDEIIGAAKKAGMTVGVSHNQLFYPPHIRAKELIDSGAIGQPLLLRLRLGVKGKFPGWRSDPKATGGGLLFDAGVHRFYVARALFGEVRDVAAVVDVGPEEGENLAVITLRFASGALGVIEANYHCPPGTFDDAIEVTGSEAMLYISGCEADFEGFRTGPALRRYDGSWHDEHVPPGSWDDSVYASVQGFVSALRAGTPPPVTAEDGRAIVDLIETVYRVEERVSAG